MTKSENNRTYAVYSDVYTKAGEFDSLQAAVDYCRHNNGNQIIERGGKITRSYIVTTTDIHLVI